MLSRILCSADFHPPPVVADAMIAVRQLAGVAAFPFGGYAQAERTRILLGQEDIIEALKADPQQVSCKAQVKGQCVHFCNCCSKTCTDLCSGTQAIFCLLLSRLARMCAEGLRL